MKRIPSPNPRQVAAKSAALLAVAVLAVLSWYLIHGTAACLYTQYAAQGDPPGSVAPMLAGKQSQLGHVGYFWSERAFHYRTALMFATDGWHDPGSLSADRYQQYPDGVDSWREYTVLMEPVYGQLYRWFGERGETFVDFLLRLIPLVHVLLFLPVYLLARALGVRLVLAVGAVAVYATASMGFDRLTGSLLLKETFALVWLMSFLAAFFSSWRFRSAALAWLTMPFLVLLLASWHLSQFLVLVFLVAVALSRTHAGVTAGDDPETGPRWRSWTRHAGCALACGLLIVALTPTLRERNFALSLTTLAAAAWGVVVLATRLVPVLRRSTRWRLGLLAGVLVGAGLLSVLNQHHAGSYSHVSGLFWQKLAHGFTRPEDPTALPFAVRVFWTEPFNVVRWSQVTGKLGAHVLLLIPTVLGGAWLVLRRDVTPRNRAYLLIVFPFLIAWLFVERMGVVFWPLGAVLIARAAERSAGFLGRRMAAPLATTTMALVLAVAAVANILGPLETQIAMARDHHAGRAAYVQTSDDAQLVFAAELFRWITANTPGPGAQRAEPRPRAFLGDIGVSVQLLLYTGRPIVLNSQFENELIRDRHEAWLAALYSEREADLVELARRWRAGYLFIDRTFATTDEIGSPRYIAGVQAPLNLRQTIVRLHFDPEGLEYFEPVYNNEFYRVFRVLDRPRDPARNDGLTWPRNFGGWWDLDSFTVEGEILSDLAADRRALGTLEQRLLALQTEEAMLLATDDSDGRGPSLQRLRQMLMQARLEQVIGPLGQARPGTPPPAQRIVQFEAELARRLGRVDPATGLTLADSLEDLLDSTATGDEGWLTLLDPVAAEPIHLATAAQLLGLLGRNAEAAEFFRAAASRFPELPCRAGTGGRDSMAAPMAQRLRFEAVRWRIEAGDQAGAAVLARQWLPLADAGMPVTGILDRVARLP